jgi:hypothetical protein
MADLAGAASKRCSEPLPEVNVSFDHPHYTRGKGQSAPVSDLWNTLSLSFCDAFVGERGILEPRKTMSFPIVGIGASGDYETECSSSRRLTSGDLCDISPDWESGQVVDFKSFVVAGCMARLGALRRLNHPISAGFDLLWFP